MIEQDEFDKAAERLLPCGDIRFNRPFGELLCCDGVHDEGDCPAFFRADVATALRSQQDEFNKRRAARRGLLEKALHDVGLDPDGLTDIGCVDELVKAVRLLRSQHESDARYHNSYIKQADDTLALILKGYDIEHVHDECGLICKINEIEGLPERQHEASYRQGFETACARLEATANALGHHPLRQEAKMLRDSLTPKP